MRIALNTNIFQTNLRIRDREKPLVMSEVSDRIKT